MVGIGIMKTCPQCNRVQLLESSKCQWEDCQYIEGSEIDKSFKPKSINEHPTELVMKFKSEKNEA